MATINFRTPLTCAALLASLVAAGCPAPPFDYEERTTPRVWVGHSPLNPDPGETITFTATADLGSASVDEIFVQALLPGGGGDRTCAANPCQLTAAAGRDGLALYSARVTTAGGETAVSGGYAFHVGQPAPGEPIALRVPFDLLEGDQGSDVLLVADRASYPGGPLAMRADAEAVLYDGLLADPAYRWRDRQLAFWLSRYLGTTSGYDSGLQTRCGQGPWIGSADGPLASAAAAFADVLGVIHRRGFRDCAGLGIVPAGAGAKRHFSADGRDPQLFHHEFGHAFAGLSDEYTESTASRTADGGNFNLPLSCICCDETGGPGTVDPGEPGFEICQPGQPPCAGFVAPPECFPAPPACPPLGGWCEHLNIFPDEATCRSAALDMQTHPGVENPQPPDDCRLLCSNHRDGVDACPCTEDQSVEWWLLDRRQPPAAGADDDVMGLLDGLAPAEQHGPACQRCIETRLCIDWELARDQTESQALEHCLDPREAGE